MLHPKRLVKSFRYAFEGIKLGLQVDHNLRIHFIVATIIILLSWILQIPFNEFLFVLLAITFVIFAELINTAIEEMTNLIIKEHRTEAKIAKDVSAAAVLFAAIFAVIVGAMVFIPRLVDLFFG